MKTYIKGLLAVSLCLNLLPVHAQPGSGMGGSGRGTPQISAAMTKLFGDNQAFSATVESNIKLQKGDTITMPGKIAFDSGKSRFEMNMSDAKGSALPPEAVAQMKSMGMDRMVIISLPEQKKSVLIYPGLNAYAEMPTPESAAAKEADFKITTTELGKETVDGHPCVKNKAVVTDDKGKEHVSTVWNATDLKNFPVKIDTTEEGMTMTMVFKNVKLAKPDADQFNPPAGFKKYDSMMSLMQQEMMKRMQQQQGGMPGQE